MIFRILASVALFFGTLTASIASAAVDGTYKAEYGAPTASVGYDPDAPNGNFGAPGSTNASAGYDIYLLPTADTVNVLLRADRLTGLQFANLYWDLDPANANGSDLGFEVTNDRAFVPGKSGYSGPLGLTFAQSVDGLGLEVALPNELFTTAIAGLDYWPGQAFPANGDDVVLRLSQSFGYSVAGGASYGPDRLGRVTLGSTAGAIPEPSAWAMLIAGFGGIGILSRRRFTRQRVVTA